MFCSNCGNELRQGLKYCNRCGSITTAELEKAVTSSDSAKIVQILSGAVGAIGVVGVITFAAIIIRLLRMDDIKPPAFLLVLVFSVTILGIIFLLSRQISNMSNKHFLSAAKDSFAQPQQSLPHTGNTAQLEAPRQPIGSVTDHTTRIFEEKLAEKFKN